MDQPPIFTSWELAVKGPKTAAIGGGKISRLKSPVMIWIDLIILILRSFVLEQYSTPLPDCIIGQIPSVKEAGRRRRDGLLTSGSGM
jgi:hypothetical protein